MSNNQRDQSPKKTMSTLGEGTNWQKRNQSQTFDKYNTNGKH